MAAKAQGGHGHKPPMEWPQVQEGPVFPVYLGSYYRAQGSLTHFPAAIKRWEGP